MIIAGQYPVVPFNKYNIQMWVIDTIEPKTVRQVMEKFNISKYEATKILAWHVEHGFLNRRYRTEWNGMFYIKVGYYW